MVYRGGSRSPLTDLFCDVGASSHEKPRRRDHLACFAEPNSVSLHLVQSPPIHHTYELDSIPPPPAPATPSKFSTDCLLPLRTCCPSDPPHLISRKTVQPASDAASFTLHVPPPNLTYHPTTPAQHGSNAIGAGHREGMLSILKPRTHVSLRRLPCQSPRSRG